ncbi:MAG: L-rhamnose mutarotase [Lewinellaceae bacterium]|nr:L-rhamnose mutarotase [Lewinellaceae bacterium]
MEVQRICLACDLKDDPAAIARYKKYHAPGALWPEVGQSIRDAGIVAMEIYLTGNRLFMIMEVDASFKAVRKAKADAANPKVQDWEALMWQFQQALPWAKPGEKWVPMERIFLLEP